MFSACAVLLALLALAAEGAGAIWGTRVRVLLYAGEVAGVLVVAAGAPFVYKLSRIAAMPHVSRAFWVWWGSGFLVRLVSLMSLAVVLGMVFRAECADAILALAATYLLGLLVETYWLAKVYFRAADNRS